MSIHFSEVKFSNCVHPKYQPHLKNKKIILNLEDINDCYETVLVGAIKTLPAEDFKNFDPYISRAKLAFANYCVKAKNLNQKKQINT